MSVLHYSHLERYLEYAPECSSPFTCSRCGTPHSACEGLSLPESEQSVCYDCVSAVLEAIKRDYEDSTYVPESLNDYWDYFHPMNEATVAVRDWQKLEQDANIHAGGDLVKYLRDTYHIPVVPSYLTIGPWDPEHKIHFDDKKDAKNSYGKLYAPGSRFNRFLIDYDGIITPKGSQLERLPDDDGTFAPMLHKDGSPMSDKEIAKAAAREYISNIPTTRAEAIKYIGQGLLKPLSTPPTATPGVVSPSSVPAGNVAPTTKPKTKKTISSKPSAPTTAPTVSQSGAVAPSAANNPTAPATMSTGSAPSQPVVPNAVSQSSTPQTPVAPTVVKSVASKPLKVKGDYKKRVGNVDVYPDFLTAGTEHDGKFFPVILKPTYKIGVQRVSFDAQQEVITLLFDGSFAVGSFTLDVSAYAGRSLDSYALDLSDAIIAYLLDNPHQHIPAFYGINGSVKAFKVDLACQFSATLDADSFDDTCTLAITSPLITKSDQRIEVTDKELSSREALKKFITDKANAYIQKYYPCFSPKNAPVVFGKKVFVDLAPNGADSYLLKITTPNGVIEDKIAGKDIMTYSTDMGIGSVLDRIRMGILNGDLLKGADFLKRAITPYGGKFTTLAKDIATVCPDDINSILEKSRKDLDLGYDFDMALTIPDNKTIPYLDISGTFIYKPNDDAVTGTFSCRIASFNTDAAATVAKAILQAYDDMEGENLPANTDTVSDTVSPEVVRLLKSARGRGIKKSINYAIQKDLYDGFAGSISRRGVLGLKTVKDYNVDFDITASSSGKITGVEVTLTLDATKFELDNTKVFTPPNDGSVLTLQKVTASDNSQRTLRSDVLVELSISVLDTQRNGSQTPHGSFLEMLFGSTSKFGGIMSEYDASRKVFILKHTMERQFIPYFVRRYINAITIY